MNITQQQAKDKVWKDETGTAIPYNRTTPYERTAEKTAYRLATKALKIHNDLVAYKEDIQKEAESLYGLFCKENGVPGKGRGGVTIYNFDRSIKVEVRVQDRIEFDPNTIALAKEILDELLTDGLDGAKDFIKPIVMDAFSTTGGKLDTKRVLGLKRHASRVRNARYDEAMALVDKAIRKPDSKVYYQIWVRNAKGEYEDIQLNLSAI